MSEEADKPRETTKKEDRQVESGLKGLEGPSPSRKKKNQAVLVWVGIACLILAGAASWKVADKKEKFKQMVRILSNPQNREGQANAQLMQDWAGKLRNEGGPLCKSIAEMIISEQVPDRLKQEGITNLDDVLGVVGDGGRLQPIYLSELTGQLNILAWILAIAGIVLIGLDILRERGKLKGKKM